VGSLSAAATMSHGRYEVAIDSLVDFRVYRNSGPQPMAQRIKELAESNEPMTIRFEGRRFTWHPGSGDLLPTVTIPIEDSENEYAERFAMERFLSAMSYVFGFGITVYSAAGSGYKKELDPPLLRQPRMKATIFPAPSVVELADVDDDLSLCLGLMREGMASNSQALAFLSYWKVVEVAIGEGFTAWVGRSAADLWPKDGRDADRWYEYLNETRVAAAHAIPWDPGKLRYHPDDPRLDARVRDDVRLMLKLAKRALDERWATPVREDGA
jgi:hypothetical protein